MKKCLEIVVFSLLVLAGAMGLKAVSSQTLIAGIGAPVPPISGTLTLKGRRSCTADRQHFSAERSRRTCTKVAGWL